MFHVKHFGTIDSLRKHICVRRGEVGSQDFDLARCWDRFYFLAVLFFETAFPVPPSVVLEVSLAVSGVTRLCDHAARSMI
jgi:hypothetical protein